MSSKYLINSQLGCESCKHASEAIEKFVDDYRRQRAGEEDHLASNLMAIAIEENMNDPNVQGNPHALMAFVANLTARFVALRERMFQGAHQRAVA